LLDRNAQSNLRSITLFFSHIFATVRVG
jgi:hypothetical protein